MAAGDVVVEGVDALEHHDLILAQLQGSGPAVIAHMPGKLILRNPDLLPFGQGGEVPVQQLHIQAQGGFVVDVPLRGPGSGAGVDGMKVVVHRHRVGVDPPALELLGDLHGGGGLSGAGGAGEEHDGAAFQIGEDFIRGQGHPLGVVVVALGQELLDVRLDAAVDLLQLISHGKNSFLSIGCVQIRALGMLTCQAGPKSGPGKRPRFRPSGPESCPGRTGSRGGTWGWGVGRSARFSGPPAW